MGCVFTKAVTDYTIYVQTGDRRNAGTDANVKIMMHDEDGNSSEPITLDNYFRNDFERGCLDTFHVPSTKIKNLQRTSKINRIELWKDDAWVASDWYVDKIVVENRLTNDTSVFPIFRWIKSDYHYQIKHLDTSLPQHEEYPEQRQMELAEKRKVYEFQQKVKNGPAQVKQMPSDEQFSFDYKFDIVKTKVKLIAVSKIVMLTAGEWDTLEALKNIYTEKIFNMPKVSPHVYIEQELSFQTTAMVKTSYGADARERSTCSSFWSMYVAIYNFGSLFKINCWNYGFLRQKKHNLTHICRSRGT